MLVFSKMCRNYKRGDFSVLQCIQEIVPILIFYEDCQLRIPNIQKSFGVALRIQGQIEYPIGTLIILAYVVARWRKECQQDFVFWKCRTECFHHRSALLKFAKGSTMKPYAGSGVRISIAHQQKQVSPTCYPLLGFGRESPNNESQDAIKVYRKAIEQSHSANIDAKLQR